MNYKFGPLVVGFDGDHAALQWIHREFQGCAVSDGVSADIGFLIVPDRVDGYLGELKGGTRLVLRHGVGSTEAGVVLQQAVKHGPLLYRVTIQGGEVNAGSIRVITELSRPIARLPNSVGRMLVPLTRDGSALDQLIAKNFLYEVFDPVVWWMLLRKDMTLIHSSALVHDSGHVVMLAGTGGAGKSTMLLRLMREPHWNYLGDDLVIIDRHGLVFRHPKWLQVYDYNLSQEPMLRSSLLSDLSPARRVLWTLRTKLFGSKQARRRISAVDLFGPDRVAEAGRLATFIWLGGRTAGGSEGGLRVSELSPRRTAELATAAIADEMWGFLQLLNLAGVTGGMDSLAYDLLSRSMAITEGAVSEAGRYQIQTSVGAEEQLLAWLDAEVASQ